MKDEMWIEAIGGTHCTDCRFFVEEGPGGGDKRLGECRARAPLALNTNVGYWPIVAADDWCGEFELSPSRRRAFEAEWLERWNGRLK